MLQQRFLRIKPKTRDETLETMPAAHWIAERRLVGSSVVEVWLHIVIPRRQILFARSIIEGVDTAD